MLMSKLHLIQNVKEWPCFDPVPKGMFCRAILLFTFVRWCKVQVAIGILGLLELGFQDTDTDWKDFH